MADTKISALAAVVTPATSDEFAVNQGGVSKKITLAQILSGTVPGAVPIGFIGAWSGTIAAIPTGWALCDGTANSPGPDLRDKFIIGAKQDDSGTPKTNVTGSLTQTGGAATHSDHVASSAAVSAHSLSTDVALSAHSLSTNVALSAHSLSTNVAIADHTLVTSQGRTSTASTRAFVTTTTLAHTITQPVVSAHSITQPVVSAHSITQPVVAAHSVTQPTIGAGSSLPPYFALAYIQRMS